MNRKCEGVIGSGSAYVGVITRTIADSDTVLICCLSFYIIVVSTYMLVVNVNSFLKTAVCFPYGLVFACVPTKS